jgi:FHA domain/Trypsin
MEKAQGRATENLRHNLNQSVGSGIRSVFGNKGRTYYVLQHRTRSAFHKLGEEKEIIIDYIELGRDSKCQIRFDESMDTVSRRHAAIYRDGNAWILKNLSQRNPTLINGRPVKVQWFLSNGDEIQLSMEGPKIGFITPGNNAVSSIPLSRRLSLFREQSLRPYRQALIAMGVVFMLSVAGLTYWIWQQNNQIQQQQIALAAAVEKGNVLQGNIDSVRTTIKTNEKTIKSLQDQIKKIKKTQRRSQSGNSNNSAPPAELVNLRSVYPDVYFILVDKLEVIIDGETEIVEDYGWSGTGFLLDDGSFVTARHVIEPWLFINTKSPDPSDLILNLVYNNGGRVIAHLTAYSNGKTIKLKSSSFSKYDKNDSGVMLADPTTGAELIVTLANIDDGNDWAVQKVSESGKLRADYSLSTNLAMGSKLHVLGFPQGLGATSPTDIEPMYSSCDVSRSGTAGGIINVSARGYEQGNSGGPVLFGKGDGSFVVVGIVSAGVGEKQGFLVPIANIK